jgi:hypothetical protein
MHAAFERLDFRNHMKLTPTDRADLVGGTVFLLLLATALFLSAFL